MRKNIKIPRILKINWIKDLSISVVYNNGESRIIDFHKVEDGVYELIFCNESRDWETGYVDDHDYKLVELNE